MDNIKDLSNKVFINSGVTNRVIQKIKEKF